MKSMTAKSKWIKIAAGAAVALVVIALVIPELINVDSLRPRLESILGSSLAREVHIGRIELSLLAGELRAQDVSIADDPAFSSERFLESKALGIRVGLISLLFSHTLHVNSLTLEQPRVNLVRSASGEWNFSTIGGGGEHEDVDSAMMDSWLTPSDGEASQPFVFDQIKIVNATLMLPASAAAGTEESTKATLQNINIDLRSVNLDKVMSFVISERMEGGAKIEVHGEAGPVDRTSPENTPFHSTITLTRTDLAQAMGPFYASGLRGVLSLYASVVSDGKQWHGEGHGRVEKLRLSRTGTPASDPISFSYATVYSLATQSGVIRSGAIAVGAGRAEVSGSYTTRKNTFVSHIKLSGSELPLESVQEVLAALGIEPPAGSKLRGGTVTATVSLDGPGEGLVTSGKADIADAKLTAFDLGAKLASIPGLGGLQSGPDLGIVSLSSEFRFSAQDTRISNLKGDLSGIGGVTGGGNIDATSHLDLAMVAHIPNHGATRWVLDHVGLRGVPNEVPFKVEGTASLPIFEPDLSVMAKSAVRNAASEAVTKMTTETKKNASAAATGATSDANSATGGTAKALAKQPTSAEKPNVAAPKQTSQSSGKKPGLLGRIFHRDRDKEKDKAAKNGALNAKY